MYTLLSRKEKEQKIARFKSQDLSINSDQSISLRSLVRDSLFKNFSPNLHIEAFGEATITVVFTAECKTLSEAVDPPSELRFVIFRAHAVTLFVSDLFVLLVLTHEVIGVALRLGELHLVHTLAGVEVEMSLATEHAGELFAHGFHRRHHCTAVQQTERCGFTSGTWVRADRSDSISEAERFPSAELLLPQNTALPFKT